MMNTKIKTYFTIASAVLISCGIFQAMNWFVPQFTESKRTAFVQSCRLVTEPGFQAAGLPTESNALIEQCTINLDRPGGAVQQLRRRYQTPPLAPMQELAAIGSTQWPDTFRLAGEPRDTGTLRAAMVLTAVGALLILYSRRT
jgi:hypothetical protein